MVIYFQRRELRELITTPDYLVKAFLLTVLGIVLFRGGIELQILHLEQSYSKSQQYTLYQCSTKCTMQFLNRLKAAKLVSLLSCLIDGF